MPVSAWAVFHHVMNKLDCVVCSCRDIWSRLAWLVFKAPRAAARADCWAEVKAGEVGRDPAALAPRLAVVQTVPPGWAPNQALWTWRSMDSCPPGWPYSSNKSYWAAWSSSAKAVPAACQAD